MITNKRTVRMRSKLQLHRHTSPLFSSLFSDGNDVVYRLRTQLRLSHPKSSLRHLLNSHRRKLLLLERDAIMAPLSPMHQTRHRIGVAIGDWVLDLSVVAPVFFTGPELCNKLQVGVVSA